MNKKIKLEDLPTWKLRLVKLMQQENELKELQSEYNAMEGSAVNNEPKFQVILKIVSLKNDMIDTALEMAGDLISENKNLKKFSTTK